MLAITWAQNIFIFYFFFLQIRKNKNQKGTLMQIPWHSGIGGNEARLAAQKEVSEGMRLDPEIWARFAVGKLRV